MVISRRFVTTVALVVLGLVLRNAAAAAAAPLSESDLLKLVELQIGDDAIVAKIEKDGIDFSLNGPLKERLRKAGATDRVLAAMEKRGMTASPAAESKVAEPIMVWVKREYGHVENPLYTEFSVNGKMVDIFTSDTRKEIGKHLQRGWNTITMKTTPQQGASSDNGLIFHIGPVHKDPKSDQDVMKPVLWTLRNGTDWKFNDGRFSHRLGPEVKEVTLSYRVYYAGLDLERSDVQNGDFVLQGKPEYGHVSSPLTFTVFVNGTPLTSFLGAEREILITSLLKEGKNDFKVVSSRSKDVLQDNDVRVQVIGPLHYNPRRERFEGKPVVELRAMQGWERERQSGQLVAKADRQADSIERNVAFMLDEAPGVARRPATSGSRQ